MLQKDKDSQELVAAAPPPPSHAASPSAELSSSFQTAAQFLRLSEAATVRSKTRQTAVRPSKAVRPEHELTLTAGLWYTRLTSDQNTLIVVVIIILLLVLLLLLLLLFLLRLLLPVLLLFLLIFLINLLIPLIIVILLLLFLRLSFVSSPLFSLSSSPSSFYYY